MVNKMKKNKELLRQLIDRRDQQLMKQSVVQKVIRDLMDEKVFISSAKLVIDEVKLRLDIDVTTSYVLEQMHNLGLKYSKVKHISMQGNSAKSLVLRQRWALAFLEMDYKTKNVINIDETWLGMTDFRRYHWKWKKVNCSIKAKQLAPRISMITGVDKLGNIYLSLS